LNGQCTEGWEIRQAFLGQKQFKIFHFPTKIKNFIVTVLVSDVAEQKFKIILFMFSFRLIIIYITYINQTSVLHFNANLKLLYLNEASYINKAVIVNSKSFKNHQYAMSDLTLNFLLWYS
jgi:hypothetical protein